MQRGTPRESDTASRREVACLLNPCNVVAQLVTSQPVTVHLTLTCFSYTDVLGQVGSLENSSHHPLCTAHFYTFCVVSHSCIVPGLVLFWGSGKLKIDLVGNNTYLRESNRTCQQVGCARNKLQFHRVLLNLRLFLRMQVFAWMEDPLLISGTWSMKCYILLLLNPEHWGNLCRDTQSENRSDARTKKHSNPLEDLRWTTVDSLQTQNSRFYALPLFIFFFFKKNENIEDNEAVNILIIEGRSPTMRHVEPQS